MFCHLMLQKIRQLRSYKPNRRDLPSQSHYSTLRKLQPVRIQVTLQNLKQHNSRAFPLTGITPSWCQRMPDKENQIKEKMWDRKFRRELGRVYMDVTTLVQLPKLFVVTTMHRKNRHLKKSKWRQGERKAGRERRTGVGREGPAKDLLPEAGEMHPTRPQVSASDTHQEILE